MKDAAVTIEYLTHCLASGRKSDKGYDEFEKDGDGKLIWRQSWWYAALARAIDMAGVRGVKPGYFSFSPTVSAAVIVYKRKYGYDKFRTHEAIAPGTKVVFDLVVHDSVTLSVMERIFDKMGKFVGLTPYGHGLGFGKFRLISVVCEGEKQTKGDSQDESKHDGNCDGAGPVGLDERPKG